MSLKKNGRLSRREAMKALSICAAGGALGLQSFLAGCRETGPGGDGGPGTSPTPSPGTSPTPQPNSDPKFLIVVGATGGASIIDSFLAVREGECSSQAVADGLNTFPDANVVDIAGSNLRAVDQNDIILGSPFAVQQSIFANKHRDDILVTTHTGSSVNHTVAQRRSANGNGAWAGRTLPEIVAAEYGQGLPLPNVNMAFGGFADDGADTGTPGYALKETVSNPALWPLGLDGYAGIKDLPEREIIDLARGLRNGELDPNSVFFKTFEQSDALKRWVNNRATTQPQLEGMDLITALNVFPDAPPNIPLTEYGLQQSPDGPLLLQTFPQFLTDPLEAQAALAFLLIKYGVSVTVSISPSFDLILGSGTSFQPPLSFDFSHQDHRAGQAIMWNRMLSIADRLIDLLKGEEWQNTGTSYWDRSMIYFATDFGRSKTRQPAQNDFGTGHHLNNGTVAISPMLNGGRALGGVDPETALTYGFDPVTGAPDTGRNMTEYEIFGGLVQALGISTSALGTMPDMPIMRG